MVLLNSRLLIVRRPGGGFFPGEFLGKTMSRLIVDRFLVVGKCHGVQPARAEATCEAATYRTPPQFAAAKTVKQVWR
jgi:hypothetical protein